MILSVTRGGNERGVEGGREMERKQWLWIRAADVPGEGKRRARAERKCLSLESTGCLSSLLPQG